MTTSGETVQIYMNGVKIVGMVVFQGSVIVATELGVFRMVDGKFVPIPFAVHEQPPAARIEDRFEQSPQG